MSESAERIYALLVDANPVPDVEQVPTILAERPHLYVIDSRRDAMQTELRPEEEVAQAPPPRQRRWIPAAAAAVVVAAAIGVSIFALSGDSDEPAPPATEAPVTTTAPVIQSVEEVGRSAIAAWNAGDVDAFVGLFSADGLIQNDWSATDGGLANDVEFYMGLGQQATIEECTVSGDTVTCVTSTADDLSGPLGISTEVHWVMSIAGSEITQLNWEFPVTDTIDSWTVIDDMIVWLGAEHLDVYDDWFRPLGRCDFEGANFYGTWCSSARAADEMMRLAPEFRAQAEY